MSRHSGSRYSADYNIDSIDKAWATLVEQVFHRAEDDEWYWINHQAPPGQQGHGIDKTHYSNILKEDPMQEWNESWLFYYVKKYFRKQGVMVPETICKRKTVTSGRWNNTSGYTGISYNNHYKKWEVYINKNKKRKFVGRFITVADALRAKEAYGATA